MLKKPSQSYDFYTFEQWQLIIQKWKDSGLSIYQFCKEHKITDSAFRRWLNKVNSSNFSTTNTASSLFPDQEILSSPQPDKKSSLQDLFIPITLKPETVPTAPSKDSSKVELTLSGGHKLLIQGAFDWDSVMTLLTPLLTQ